MSCCGQGEVGSRGTGPDAEAARWAGWSRIAYLGGNRLEVRGTFSGQRYRFSPDARIEWVRADDARVMLRTRYFRRAG